MACGGQSSLQPEAIQSFDALEENCFCTILTSFCFQRAYEDKAASMLRSDTESGHLKSLHNIQLDNLQMLLFKAWPPVSCFGYGVRVLLTWASAAYLDDRLAWKLIKGEAPNKSASSLSVQATCDILSHSFECNLGSILAHCA